MTTTNSAPNCYECKYRRSLPGDAHSRCAHPRIPNDNRLLAIFQEMTSGVELKGVPSEQAIHVTGNPAASLADGLCGQPTLILFGWKAVMDTRSKKLEG